jgi:hypothetical protein
MNNTKQIQWELQSCIDSVQHKAGRIGILQKSEMKSLLGLVQIVYGWKMSASKIIIIIINCVTEIYESTGKKKIVYPKDVSNMVKSDVINYMTDLWATQMYIHNIVVINKQ